jgi:hypothetical protein
MGEYGSPYLEKEYMEFFRGTTSITINNFCDIRIRGVPGEFDQVFVNGNETIRNKVNEYGSDFLEMLMGELVRRQLHENELQVSEGWNRIPSEKVHRIGTRFDIDTTIQELGLHKSQPASIANFLVDKGWARSLEHFAECFLNGVTPKNADAEAGVMASVIPMAALKSLKTGEKVDVHLPKI